MGDGLRVSFWYDKWCSNHCLCDTYPGLFEMAREKDAVIADLLAFSNGSLNGILILIGQPKIGNWSLLWSFLQLCIL